MQGEVYWILLIDQWISRHYNYSNSWVWLLMQLQFRVLLSVQLLNIWPTTTILKRYLNFMVDQPGSKHSQHRTVEKETGKQPRSQGISSSCSAPLETRFARKTAETVWRIMIAWSTLSKINTQRVISWSQVISFTVDDDLAFNEVVS